MRFFNKVYLIVLSLFYIQSMVLCEIPEVIENWEDLPNPKYYSMNFRAVYTRHYVNEIEKDLDKETGKIITKVLRSYIPDDALFIQWEGKLSFTDDNLEEEEREPEDERKLKIDAIRISNDNDITTMTHYVTATEVFSLYHTNKLARQTSSGKAPFMLEWPYWVPFHPAMQKTRYFPAYKGEDLFFAGKTQNGGAIIKYDKTYPNFYFTLIFDGNGFLSEYDATINYWRRHFQLKYIQTEQGIVLTECVIQRYYKKSLMPETPIETFGFYADLDTISFQDVETFSEFPPVPKGYQVIDDNKHIYMHNKEEERILFSEKIDE